MSWGPNDEQVLAKRFDKNIGPKAVKIQDPVGSYLKTTADKHFQVLQMERGEHAKVAQDIGTESLNEFLGGDSKDKKEHARKALAKGAPKRKAKSLGSVVSRHGLSNGRTIDPKGPRVFQDPWDLSFASVGPLRQQRVPE